MGYPIAFRLMRAGIPVVGHDISKVAEDRFAEAGGRLSDLPSALRDSDVVVLAVLDEQQIRSVLYDEAGLLRPLKAGASSSAHRRSRSISSSRDADSRGGVSVSHVPVSGGLARAASGAGDYVAGQPDVIERAMFVEQHSQAAGARGRSDRQGHRMKLINQLLVTGHLVVAARRLRLPSAPDRYGASHRGDGGARRQLMDPAERAAAASQRRLRAVATPRST